jgi:hypothetical protein
MTLRDSLKTALRFALDVSTDRSLTLATSTLRGDYGKQKVRLHVGMESKVKGEVKQFSRTFDVLQSSRDDVSEFEATVLAEATTYVHGVGGHVR